MVQEIEISPSNRVSRRDAKHIEPTRVEGATISCSGQWLATIDVRAGLTEGFGLELYLKIWEWVGGSQSWILNTKILRPHGENRVLCMDFNPRNSEEECLLVTTGSDLQIKMWKRKQISPRNDSGK